MGSGLEVKEAFRAMGWGTKQDEEEGGTAPHAKWESFVEPEVSLLSLPWTGCGLGLAPGSQGIVEE